MKKRYKKPRSGRPSLIVGGFDYIDYVLDTGNIDNVGSLGAFIDLDRYHDIVVEKMKSEYPKDIIPHGYPPYEKFMDIVFNYKNLADSYHHDNHMITAAYLFAGMSVLRWDLVQAKLDEDYQ